MKTNSRVLTAGLLIAALAVPAASAQAEAFVTAAALAGDRERIAAVLARSDAAPSPLIVVAGVVVLAVAGVVALVKKGAS